MLALEGWWPEARAVAEDLHGREHGAMHRLANALLGALLGAGRGGRRPGPGARISTRRLHGPARGGALRRGAEDTAAGDLPTARAWLGCHDRRLAWSGAVLGRARLGDPPPRGRRFGRSPPARQGGLTHAGEPRQPLTTLAAHRLHGEFATAAGRHAAARDHLDQALTLAAACAAPYERAPALLATAELRAAATGEREAIEAALAKARAILDPLGARPALARADALAARLAAAAAPPAALPFGLSAREVEALRLVAASLTNAQVAARLFVTPRTVNAHLTTIYGKLGVAGRAAAIRVALDHGLR